MFWRTVLTYILIHLSPYFTTFLFTYQLTYLHTYISTWLTNHTKCLHKTFWKSHHISSFRGTKKWPMFIYPFNLINQPYVVFFTKTLGRNITFYHLVEQKVARTHTYPFKLGSQPYEVFSQSLLIKPVNRMMIKHHPKRKITRSWNMLKTILKDVKFLHECYIFFPTCLFVFLSYFI